MNKPISTVDLCVCCGEPVPEGRMVCIKCEMEANRGRAYHKAKRCGNAVCPPLAQAVVRANCSHLIRKEQSA